MLDSTYVMCEQQRISPNGLREEGNSTAYSETLPQKRAHILYLRSCDIDTTTAAMCSGAACASKRKNLRGLSRQRVVVESLLETR